jgi:hypothetical protein
VAARITRLTYGRVNVIRQLHERLSIGAEGLSDGARRRNGAEGDVFRFQLGLVYSIFD